MIKKYNFFDKSLYKKGLGHINEFEVNTFKNDKLVFDKAAGLMWQQGGSSNKMDLEHDAKTWINEINENRFAGYNDWRLPTLEEAMSLMEREPQNENLYIDSVFDKKQVSIWTSDSLKGWNWQWVVGFDVGYCYGSFYMFYVRAVRSGQSSEK